MNERLSRKNWKMCKDLTDNQMKLTNGCGSSYWLVWLFRVPKWLSEKMFCCCGCHDYQYLMQKDKEIADLELKACIYYNAFKSPKYQRWAKIKIANLIYWALNTKMSQKCYNINKTK